MCGVGTTRVGSDRLAPRVRRQPRCARYAALHPEPPPRGQRRDHAASLPADANLSCVRVSTQHTRHDHVHAGAEAVFLPGAPRRYIGNGRIAAATVTTTPTFSVVARDTVFAGEGFNLSTPVHAAFDIAPDGKHRCCCAPWEGTTISSSFIDWMSELRLFAQWTTTTSPHRQA